MECKLCGCNLTSENRHFIHKNTCMMCVARRMREGRQKRRDFRAVLELIHHLQIALNGPNVPLCECGVYLIPRHFYKCDPTRCKKCLVEKYAKEGVLRKCNSCEKELPMTEFNEGNRSTCRSCIKNYKALRYKVLKACREEVFPSI